MNIGEKIIKLREQKGISQEELSTKLNIAQQTLAEWEINKTQPNHKQLVKMSKIFNVNVDEFIKQKTNFDIDEIKPRKWLLSILIVIAIAISSFFVYEIIENRKNNPQHGFFDSFFSKFDKDFDKSRFNNLYETIYNGELRGTSVINLLEEVITNNKTNENHVITIIYDEEKTVDVNKIKDLKQQFDKFKSYDISLDYDDDGYINQITIEKLELNVSTSLFNIRFTHSAGIQSGFFLETTLTNVIDSNKKFPNHIIKVVYKDKTYIDEEDIKKIRNGLDTFTEYDVSIDYDEAGYVSVITINKQ